MTDESIDAWSPEFRREAGGLLASVLHRDPARAESIARGLAPDGRGPGVRYGVYEDSLRHPAREVAYQAAFTDLDAFLDVLDAGEPGALELGLTLAASLDPESTLPAARTLLEHTPWRMLGRALGFALGKASSEASFTLLLDSPRAPYLRDGLASNGFSGGVDRSWAVYRAAGDLTRPDLSPELRVDVLPVLSYLIRHDRERAFAEVCRLLDGSHEVVVFAAHTLASLDLRGRNVLLERLRLAVPQAPLTFAERFAVKLLLEEDPARAVDTLGGTTFLASPEGRPRLLALLDWLRDDTWRIKRGWLAADPRFAELCMGLSSDPDRDLARLSKDLVRTLPPELRPKAKRAPKKKIAPPPPSDAWVAEMEAVGAKLQRLTAFLKSTGYRFAQPRHALTTPTAADRKALARLEKKLPLPPVLSTFWRTVGAVDLRGHHPDWARATDLTAKDAREPVWLTDALVIAPAAHVIGEALDEHDDPPLALHLAPDALGKAGYSSGTLTIWLPADAEDPPLMGADETLHAHLRRALEWAGFPGFATLDDRPEAWLASARAAIA